MRETMESLGDTLDSLKMSWYKMNQQATEMMTNLNQLPNQNLSQEHQSQAQGTDDGGAKKTCD